MKLRQLNMQLRRFRQDQAQILELLKEGTDSWRDSERFEMTAEYHPSPEYPVPGRPGGQGRQGQFISYPNTSVLQDVMSWLLDFRG